MGPASESIAQLAARGVRFDLAFLDADKTGYLGYYEQVLSKSGPPGSHVAPGNAVIVAACNVTTTGSTKCQTEVPVLTVIMSGVAIKHWVCLLQLMDLNLILPGGAIVADNTLMKAGPLL